MISYYRVVAITDVSKPRAKSSSLSVTQVTGGRILETVADDDEEHGEKADTIANRCLKMALLPEPRPERELETNTTHDNSSSLVMAFELEPLPHAISKLLNSQLYIEGAECRRGVLLLTPRNTKLVNLDSLQLPPILQQSSILPQPSILSQLPILDSIDFEWDEQDLAALASKDNDVILIE